MPEYSLIEQPDSLIELLASETRIGVDTEFMRERTFNAELCLIQVATSSQLLCVDPLATPAMDAFWSNLLSCSWVLHSARQDIEVVYQTSGNMPEQIFDTQVAAGLLGYAPQLGYANLVSELFGVEIAKSHTRADWTKRPLADELLRYAAEDVEYLLPAYELLKERLVTLDRLSWAEEDSALMLDASLYDIDPATAVTRLKGARNLRGKRRSVAERLAAWRESEAVRANRPRQWIVRDTVLIELATNQPATLEQLETIDGLAPGLIRRSGKELLRIIKESVSSSSSYRPPSAPTENEKTVLKRLQAAVTACADSLGLATETIAPKKDLVSLVSGGDGEPRVLRGWRRQVIGEQLLGLL